MSSLTPGLHNQSPMELPPPLSPLLPSRILVSRVAESARIRVCCGTRSTGLDLLGRIPTYVLAALVRTQARGTGTEQAPATKSTLRSPVS